MPAEARFGVRIDFRRGEGNPRRAFQAAIALINTLQRLDRDLCHAVDANIEPLLVSESIEAGSLVVWLRSDLRRVDDQAPCASNWRPVVAGYLERSRHACIKWAAKSDAEQSAGALYRELHHIASDTDVKRFPDYAPLAAGAVAEAVRGIEQAKSYLAEGDGLSWLAPGHPPVDFDLAGGWSDAQLDQTLIRETVTCENQPMTLVLGKPDYVGQCQWQFRHGSRPISAHIWDVEWLADFQSRKIDARPGDALRCLVNIDRYYSYENVLYKETYFITKVLEVLDR